MRRDVSYLKPPKFQNFFTLSELSCELQSRGLAFDPSWIRLLEAEGRIPKAQRVKRGKLDVRLWSPEQVEEIASILADHHRGRPKESG